MSQRHGRHLKPPERHMTTKTDTSDSNAPTEAFVFPTTDNHDKLPPTPHVVVEDPTEDALDHGIAESFPASDPVSVSVSKAVSKPAKES
jgi:hypothetical protein